MSDRRRSVSRKPPIELDRRAEELQERRLGLDVLAADRLVARVAEVERARRCCHVPSVTMNGGSLIVVDQDAVDEAAGAPDDEAAAGTRSATGTP